MIVEKNISDICVGMYILDITQPKGKFALVEAGWIENEKIIDGFKKKGIERVLIDTSKQKESKVDHFSSLQKENEIFKQEIIEAKQVFDEAKTVQKKIFFDAQNNNPIDISAVSDITDESLELIFKNSSALAYVINIRHKDEYLLEHSVAVSVLITIFALYLKIEKEIVKKLSVGAFLHDVGKIKTPDYILNKPGKLTDDEFEIMKEHATHSINIISTAPEISPLSLEVVRLHHEKLNGGGYPNGVKADQISQYGRMISICDIFDALTSTRCYKAGYSQVKAFQILRSLAESNQLDTQLVDSFIKCMGVYPVGAIVQLESNRLAIVEGRNQDDPIRPKVKSFYSLQSKHFSTAINIDLASTIDDRIVKCVRADDFDLNMDEIIEFLAHQG